MSLEPVFSMEEAAWPALLTDPEGVLCRANPAALKFFGERLKTLPSPLAALWPEDSATTWQALLTNAAAGHHQVSRCPLKAADGQPFDGLFCCCPYSGNDRLLIIQLLPYPPAQPHDQQESSAAHKQKLECALQLARTVALDFNNALTSILGHTSLILGKLEPGHPWRASLLEVEKSATKAAEIANDLGTFSRTEREPRTPAAGNLNNILRRSVDYLRENSGRPNIHWTFQLEKSLFAAKFDEAKMQQAFTKILENALEALDSEGRITLSTRNLELADATQDRTVQLSPGAYVCVEFNDTGSGISEHVLPRIFEPFFTTKRASHRGLGLAWVYGILTNHGGGVAISSQPGAGTSVRVYLPAEKRHLRDSGTGSPAELNGDQTILLVDDEELLLCMGETILSSYGYRVLIASGGAKALELLQQAEPHVDLLITDMVMPGMTGGELAEKVRALSPTTRILCTSGYVWNSSKEGQENYLQKPFTSQELLRKVKEALV